MKTIQRAVQAPRTPQAEVEADAAKRLAVETCLFQYPTLYTAGTPRREGEDGGWTVPIVIAHPHHGILGTVGDLRVNVRSGKVVAPPKEQILTAGQRLYEVYADGRPAPSPPATT